MSLLSRIRNLWRLSGIKVDERVMQLGVVEASSFFRSLRKSERAKVVDMYDPLSIDLGDDKDNTDEVQS